MSIVEAFQLLDMDGDGIVTSGDLKKRIEKVGGKMTEGEARALIQKVSIKKIVEKFTKYCRLARMGMEELIFLGFPAFGQILRVRGK